MANSNPELVEYIRQAAIKRGIDPDVALRVARGEGGLNNPFRHGEAPAPKSQAAGFGDKENSFGPFQLYISGTGAGLGDRALAAGIDPRKDWKGGVDFALNEVTKKGWGQWYGAKAAGITGMHGVGGNASAQPVLPSTAVASITPSDAASTTPATPGITLNSGAGPIAATAGAVPAAATPAATPAAPQPSIAELFGKGDIKGGLAALGNNKNAMGGLSALSSALGGGEGSSQKSAPSAPPPPQISDNSAAIAQGAQAMMADLLRKKQVPGLSLGGFGAMG